MHAQGGKPSKDNTQGVDKNGVATDISTKGIEVFFENTQNSKYAFEVPNRALTQDYKKIDGKFIPFKAVIKGESEEFLAKVIIKNKEISADSLIFKTQNGTQIQAQRLENSDDYLLNLKGLHSFAVEQVQATIKQGKKYQF